MESRYLLVTLCKDITQPADFLGMHDWTRDETLRSLLEIFDRADTHARMRSAERCRGCRTRFDGG